MCGKVDEGEEDGARLLHAEESVERPFSVELEDFFGVCNTFVGNYVLTGIITLRGAVPDEESMKQR